jgi:hypothetical protein
LITTITRTHQNVLSQPAIACKPAKPNTIDNQLVTPKNTKITGKKPAKPEMNNKPNMNRNNYTHPHLYTPHPKTKNHSDESMVQTHPLPENAYIPEK